MSDPDPRADARGQKRRDTTAARFATAMWLALPLFLLALTAAWLLRGDPLGVFNNGAPPVEQLTIERRILDDAGIHLEIRAGGSEAMTIAQVQVDDAYWRFTQDPPGALPRLSSAWVRIPYPWVLGDAHVVKLVTSTGATFEHEIEAAVPTPQPQLGQLRPLALVGAFVGIVPVAIGLMFFPVLRGLGRAGMNFILALTCGLLTFLLVDMLEDAFEQAADAAAALQAPVMVVLVAAISFFALLAIGRRHGAPTALALATYIALGIGMHNFGEGLAIGTALATGAASLGAYLVFGFTLHNITEGIGIAAPMTNERPGLLVFAGLALLAGAPAILGIWLGSFALTPHWAALALAIGAGAILQVLFEVGAFVMRGRGGAATALDATVLGGFACGVGVMFVTAMLIKL